MSRYDNTKSYSDSDKSQEIFSYQGNEVIIVTVFRTGINSIAIVEDVNTGEQYEIYRNQLY
jgi:hypothetical protein